MNPYKILNDERGSTIFELHGYYSESDLNYIISCSKFSPYCQHDWKGVWLSDDLEGYRCIKCGFEAYEIE